MNHKNSDAYHVCIISYTSMYPSILLKNFLHSLKYYLSILDLCSCSLIQESQATGEICLVQVRLGHPW